MPQPPNPPQPVREGSRWRHAKPSSDEVAEWFGTVPLDAGMAHEDYIAGVVLIPAGEKVKRIRADGRGTEEVYEQTFTPYVRVDTRVAYFRRLAELRELVAVIEPIAVPRSDKPAFENQHMPDGFWWMVAGEQQTAQRFLCATWRVALYDADTYKEGWGTDGKRERRPVREGIGTKQVTGAPEINALAKAETGAIGRALGVAGILVVGTGIATAEDMMELREPAQAAPVLPEPVEESEEHLNERLMALQTRLRLYPEAWSEFAAWWNERSKQGGWTNPLSTPVEVRRGMASKMEGMLENLPADPPPADSSSSEPAETGQPSDA